MTLKKSSEKLITLGFFLNQLRTSRNQTVITHTASDLNLNGFYKAGKPGRIVIQSTDYDALHQFLLVVRSQNIKHITLNAHHERDITPEVPQMKGFQKCNLEGEFQDNLKKFELDNLWEDLTQSRIRNFPTWDMLQQLEQAESSS